MTTRIAAVALGCIVALSFTAAHRTARPGEIALELWSAVGTASMIRNGEPAGSESLSLYADGLTLTLGQILRSERPRIVTLRRCRPTLPTAPGYACRFVPYRIDDAVAARDVVRMEGTAEGGALVLVVWRRSASGPACRTDPTGEPSSTADPLCGTDVLPGTTIGSIALPY